MTDLYRFVLELKNFHFISKPLKKKFAKRGRKRKFMEPKSVFDLLAQEKLWKLGSGTDPNTAFVQKKEE